MKVLGKMVKKKEKGYFIIKMIKNMKLFGKIIKKKDKKNSILISVIRFVLELNFT